MTAWIIRFITNFKLKIDQKTHLQNLSSVLLPGELRAAENIWVKANQSNLNDELSTKDVQNNLGVVCDELGILRCRGRLKHAPLPYESRNPNFVVKES